jgi:hypothetical protein
MSLDNFTRRLEKYPHLKDRFEAILNIAENSSGKFDKADDAEMMAIEEVRKIGSELLKTWAINQEAKQKEQALINPNLIRHSKKNSIG